MTMSSNSTSDPVSISTCDYMASACLHTSTISQARPTIGDIASTPLSTNTDLTTSTISTSGYMAATPVNQTGDMPNTSSTVLPDNLTICSPLTNVDMVAASDTHPVPYFSATPLSSNTDVWDADVLTNIPCGTPDLTVYVGEGSAEIESLFEKGIMSLLTQILIRNFCTLQ